MNEEEGRWQQRRREGRSQIQLGRADSSLFCQLLQTIVKTIANYCTLMCKLLKTIVPRLTIITVWAYIAIVTNYYTTKNQPPFSTLTTSNHSATAQKSAFLQASISSAYILPQFWKLAHHRLLQIIIWVEGAITKGSNTGF